MTNQTPLIDPDMLMSLKELLGDKFGQLISAFLSDCTSRFERLNMASEIQDLEIIKNEAHGVKGSARNIGAPALAEACSTIEDQARQGKPEGLEQKISAAEQIFAAVSEELKQLA